MLLFDHNATSPLCAEAREAWLEASSRWVGNPSSLHRLGTRADRALEEARGRLAARLGCAAHEIVWTSGASEAVNMAVRHFAAGAEGEAWISAIEHPCVVESVRRYFAGRHRLIPVSGDGIADLEWLERELRAARPAFVGLMAANNETGVLQPWREALALCRAAEVPFFCDAAQWVGKLPAAGLGACDGVSGCAHKFGGPQGVGFLQFSGRVQALIVGGPQEEGRRAGTENVAGALALAAALEAREKAMESAALAERKRWRERFVQRLAEVAPGARVLGVGKDALWNTVSAVLPELEGCQRWVVKLDKHGVAASTGSACASGKEEVSHVLKAMGLSEGDASRVVRFSSGWETSEGDWERLLETIEAVWREARG